MTSVRSPAILGAACGFLVASILPVAAAQCGGDFGRFLDSIKQEAVASGIPARTADRALATGLVSEVVPDDKLEEAAKPYLDEMLTTAPLGLRLTKECLNMNIDAGSLEAAIAMEDRNQILTAQTQDVKEGFAAFVEKRAPQYQDR